MTLKILSLFDGMSCGQIAINKLGITDYEYYASEVDKHAIKVTQHNYPNTIQLGDITKLSYKDGVLYSENGEFNVGKIDLILAGSPCQGFSYAGNQLAFDDNRSRLYFTFEQLLDEISPQYFLLENVRMRPEHINTISDRLGVKHKEINSNLVSAQNRVRFYWCNWDIKEFKDVQVSLQDIIPSARGVWVYPRGYNKGGFKYTNKCPTVTTSSWQHNFLWFDCDFKKSKFTPNQVESLQTVPLNYTNCVSDNQRYKMLGNGWTVDVITHILKSGLP